MPAHSSLTGADLHAIGNKTAIVVASATAPDAIKDAADYVCDGTADEVQINAAIAALTATPNTITASMTGGGEVRLIGRFVTSAPIVCTTDQVTLSGIHWHTVIEPAAGFVGTEIIDFNRDANNRNNYFGRIKNLRIYGVDRLNASSAAINGVDFTVANGNVDGLIVHGMTGVGAIHRAFSGDTADQTNWTSCHFYGNDSHGFLATGAYDNRMHMCEAETNGGSGFKFEGGAWSVSNCMAWVNLAYGFHVSGSVSQMFFDHCKSEQNNGGVFVGMRNSSGPTNFQWRGGDILSNGWDTTNAYDDVYIDGGSNVYFTDVIMPARTYYPGQSTLARYGVNVNGSVTNVRFRNCQLSDTSLYGTGTVNILAGQEANVQFTDCRNYTPIGAATITATGSPMTITARTTEEVIYLYGGTVSGITKNGVTIATGTHANVPVVVPLKPQEAIVVTYSSAPTMVRDRK